MSEPFVAEIRIFAGNFAPRGWAFCNGQLLPIAQNTALFSLIGTTFGGDGRTTTALPDLQSRYPMHPGRGPGLTERRLGERVGAASVQLATSQMPAHDHGLVVSDDPATTGTPGSGATWADAGTDAYGPPADPVALAPAALATAGSASPHENRQPFLGIHFIIALQGLLPSRT
jgi:microcystin-dependent protein